MLVVILALILQLSSTTLASSATLERIINGVNAQPKQFPYQVYFDLYGKESWTIHCSGTIISKRIILTAAHCIKDEVTQIRIYFGAVNKANATEVGQQRLVLDRKYVTVHEHWDYQKAINDIALIRLPEELQFNEYIQPAALPSKDLTYSNEAAVSSGWGLINSNPPRSTDVLQYYNVTIISNERCKVLYPILHLHLCSAPSKSSSCSGDSGGPLVVRDGFNTLVGIISYGFLNCSLNYPVVYTRVSAYLDWIESTAGIKIINT